MKDNLRLLFGVILLSLFIWRVFLQPRPSVNELSSTVENFIEDWYINVNEEKFWSYVHPDSILNGGQANGYTINTEEAFWGAFKVNNEKRIDRSTFQLKNMDYYRRRVYYRDINNRSNILIYYGGEQFLAEYFDLTFDDDPEGEYSIETLTKKGVLPDEQYMIAIYCVGGNLSYTGECVVSYWVPLGTEWKVFMLNYFD